MDAAIVDKVREIAVDLFGVAPEAVSLASSPDTIENWDSVQHLNFVLALEQAFKVQFQPDHVEQMRSIEIAVMTVEEIRGSAR